jgi:hypothetical protein
VKPQYIFSAVIAVCLMMAALLPQIAPTQAVAPLAAAGPESLAAVVPLVEQAAVDPVVLKEPVDQIDPADQQEPAQPAADSGEAPVFLPPAAPQDEPPAIPITASLDAFASVVQNDRPNQLVGVYVDGLFALPVREQPGGEASYVSAEDNTVTRYTSPSQYGVVALLAHNYLSGRAFFSLRQNQEIVLVYGDRRMDRYRINSIQHYQALSPTDVRSDFLNLNGPGHSVLSYSQLFDHVYTTAGTLVLQTCIEANGNLSWGRMFIIANPVQ